MQVPENVPYKSHLGKVTDVSAEAVVYIPMSERDYKVFCFFGNKCQWMKKYENHLQYDGQGLYCYIPKDEEENVRREFETNLEKVKCMCTEHTEIVRDKDYNLLSTILQDMQQRYPNVCLIKNEKDIEIISDHYEDLIKVRVLLYHQMVGKMERRAGRTFGKIESQEGESNSDIDVYRRH